MYLLPLTFVLLLSTYYLGYNFADGLATVTTDTNTKTYSITATISNVEEGTYRCYPHFNDGNSPTASFTAIVGSIDGETCNFATIGESATLTCYLTASSAATEVTFAHTHSETAVSVLQLLVQVLDYMLFSA